MSQSEDPFAVPVRRSGTMHYDMQGRRMFWRFYYADGSMFSTNDTSKALRLTERMMKAGAIKSTASGVVQARLVREMLHGARVNSCG